MASKVRFPHDIVTEKFKNVILTKNRKRCQSVNNEKCKFTCLHVYRIPGLKSGDFNWLIVLASSKRGLRTRLWSV
jgi:hypothetical protein